MFINYPSEGRKKGEFFMETVREGLENVFSSDIVIILKTTNLLKQQKYFPRIITMALKSCYRRQQQTF